jgi:hypothetical protein
VSYHYTYIDSTLIKYIITFLLLYDFLPYIFIMTSYVIHVIVFSDRICNTLNLGV